MNKRKNLKDLFTKKIPLMKKEQILLLINFMTFYRIKKIKRMPSKMFINYIKNQSVQSLEISTDQVKQYKEELISNLNKKLEKIKNQDCFVLRSELNSALSILDNDTKFYRDLNDYLANVI